MYRRFLSSEEFAQIANSHTYHSPTPEAIEVHEHLRKMAFDMSVEIRRLTNPGRYQSLALTHIEDAVMWANKSVACDGLPTEETDSIPELSSLRTIGDEYAETFYDFPEWEEGAEFGPGKGELWRAREEKGTYWWERVQ